MLGCLIPFGSTGLRERSRLVTPKSEIWKVVKSELSSDEWIPVREIYAIVERGISLDGDDRMPASPGSRPPRWHRNVRNVLQHRKATGEVLWDGHGRYRRG